MKELENEIRKFKEIILILKQTRADLERDLQLYDIKDVIKRLKENWQIEIKIYKEVVI